MKTIRHSLLASVVLAGCAFLAQDGQAAPGDLDLTFGQMGEAFVGSGYLWNATVQPDGKILLTGGTRDSSELSLNMVRLNANGSRDASFVSTGLRLGSIVTNFIDQGNSVAVDKEGKIVVAGDALENYSYLAVQRLNPNGSVDTTFGIGSGIARLNYAIYDSHATCVAIQADGKIVVGGYKNTPPAFTQPMLMRFNRDGSLDTSFGSMGIVTTMMGSNGGRLKNMALQADGKIVVSGWFEMGFDDIYNILLIRYNADGSLDSSFGTAGIVLDIEGRAKGLALQGDGKILVAGNHGDYSSTDGSIWRYNANGSLDTTFGKNGVVVPVLSSNEGCYGIAVQNDGKIVGAGFTSLPVNGNYSNAAFLAVRYLPNGVVDKTFHGTGAVVTDFSTVFDAAYTMALQTDGKIVAAGTLAGSMIAMRYQGDPVTPFAAWKLAHLGQANPPDLGDPDGDGLATLTEYGLALSPETPDPAPAATLFDYAEGRRLRMFVTRDPTHNDVTVEVQAAGDLAGPWTTVVASVLGAPFAGPGYVGGDDVTPGVKTVEVRDTVNLSDVARRFMRVRVTH